MVQLLWKSPQNVKHEVTLWLNISTPRSIRKKKETICPHENLYMNVPSSIIHDSPKVETNSNVE